MFPIIIVEGVLYYSDMYMYQSCAIPEIVKKFYKSFFPLLFYFFLFLTMVILKTCCNLMFNSTRTKCCLVFFLLCFFSFILFYTAKYLSQIFMCGCVCVRKRERENGSSFDLMYSYF